MEERKAGMAWYSLRCWERRVVLTSQAEDPLHHIPPVKWSEVPSQGKWSALGPALHASATLWGRSWRSLSWWARWWSGGRWSTLPHFALHQRNWELDEGWIIPLHPPQCLLCTSPPPLPAQSPAQEVVTWHLPVQTIPEVSLLTVPLHSAPL